MEYALGKRFSFGIAVLLIKLKSWHECTCSYKVFHRGWPKIEAPKNHRHFYNIANLNCTKHNDLGFLKSRDVEFILFPSKFSTFESVLSSQILGEISLKFLCKYQGSKHHLIMGSCNSPAIPQLQ